jgi:DNA-directed RNA polymerase subunit RPC12/RpoP
MVSAFSVKGDFEITLNFEVLKDPEPADVGKSGSRLSLAVTLDTPALDTPQSEVSTLSRSMTTRGFVAWMRNRGFPKSITQTFATPAKTGRLRMVRSGDDLYQLASVGVDQPLQYLKKFRFGAEDLKRVVLTTASDGEKSFVDVRVTDLRIRADAIPGAPNVVVRTAEGKEEIVAAPAAPEERSKVWLLAGAGVAIAILGALVLALLLSKRGKAPGAPAESTTSMVSFACPNCAKALKANADSAGKRVKCPKCATGVMVPAVETSQT